MPRDRAAAVRSRRQAETRAVEARSQRDRARPPPPGAATGVAAAGLWPVRCSPVRRSGHRQVEEAA